jgi:protein TonB
MFGASSLAGKAATLLLSLSAHAAVALVVFGHHGPVVASSVAGQAPVFVELSAPELEPIDPPAVAAARTRAEMPKEPARHTHPYPVSPSHDSSPHDPSLRHVPIVFEKADSLPVQAAVVIEAGAAPRFLVTVGPTSAAPVIGAANGNGTRPGVSTTDPIAEMQADTPAKLVSGMPPAYTRAAQGAGVEADVPLEIVVDREGAVASARVLRPVGYGLDEVALRGVREYRFAPARRHGEPVAVRMKWLMRFQLR